MALKTEANHNAYLSSLTASERREIEEIMNPKEVAEEKGERGDYENTEQGPSLRQFS